MQKKKCIVVRPLEYIMDRTRQLVAGPIKALEKILESLRITKDNILEQSNRLVERINNMSRIQTLTVLVMPAVPVVPEILVPKNIVPDLRWFDED